MGDISLLLKDADNGGNGIIGGLGLWQKRQNIVHEALFDIPQNLHNLQFGRSQLLLAGSSDNHILLVLRVLQIYKIAIVKRLRVYNYTFSSFS